MQLVCISRGSYNYGKELATSLADKLGFACVSREEITDQAAEEGIPVGKLELSVLKNRPLSDSLALQIDLYKAFVIGYLCRRALEEPGVIYHGRTGHLALPGLDQVLRVRTIADVPSRIRMAVYHRHLSPQKARDYIEQVDDDIRRWVRVLYNQNWEDPSLYDVTINAANVAIKNAASALVPMAQLPDFQSTPATVAAAQGRLLASRCRLAIARDDRTRDLRVNVNAHGGSVSVTYPPVHTKQAQIIPDILEKVDGVRSLICTIASTNILYVAESFRPESEEFDHLVEVAEKWNAAIELARLTDEQDLAEEPQEASRVISRSIIAATGGVLEDDSEPAMDAQLPDPCGVRDTLQRLIQAGRAGGCQLIHSDPGWFATNLANKESYSLIVVGDVFRSKGGAQQRLKRELLQSLAESFRGPVLGTEDLRGKYLFGPIQLFRLIRQTVLFAAIYALLYLYQRPILEFVSAGHFGGAKLTRMAVSAAIVIVVPIVALIVGGFYRNILKLVRLE